MLENGLQASSLTKEREIQHVGVQVLKQFSSCISQLIGAVHESANKSSTTTDFIHTMLGNGCFFFNEPKRKSTWELKYLNNFQGVNS
jgi:hypothetical protein